MIFDFFDVKNASPSGDWQCGIVGVIAYINGNMICATNCGYCQVPAGSGPILANWIRAYPRQIGDTHHIRASYFAKKISKTEVVGEIDVGDPIIAGVSPGDHEKSFGRSDHVVLIVGYKDDGDTLVVNDPYPYQSAGLDPYGDAGGSSTEEDGQYEISYDSFVSDLHWRETIEIGHR